MITITAGAPIARPLYTDSLEDEVDNKVARSIARGPLAHVAAKELARQFTSLRRQLNAMPACGRATGTPGDWQSDPNVKISDHVEPGTKLYGGEHEIRRAYSYTLEEIMQALSSGRAINVTPGEAARSQIDGETYRAVRWDLRYVADMPGSRVVHLPVAFAQVIPVWRVHEDRIELVTSCIAHYRGLSVVGVCE